MSRSLASRNFRRAKIKPRGSGGGNDREFEADEVRFFLIITFVSQRS